MTKRKKVLDSPEFIADFVEIVGWGHLHRYFIIDDNVLIPALALVEKRRVDGFS